MSAHFLNVLRQAFKTFDRSNHVYFGGNFDYLKQLTEQLTYRDFNINQQEIFCDSIFKLPEHAPCAYMHIFENDVVSLSIFVMRGGYTMPLHDHPMMHGILRGIYGQLQIQSFTQKLKQDEPLVYNRKPLFVPAKADEVRIVTPDTECAILTPRERNFHEITAIDGVAAFFDILSPPYDADMPNIGPRRCRFYRALYDLKPMSGLQLLHIPSPPSYYCDVIDTPEDVVKCIIQCSQEFFGNGITTTAAGDVTTSIGDVKKMQ